MATISFTNLNQGFSVRDASLVAFLSVRTSDSGFQYAYNTTGGDAWNFAGANVTQTPGGVLNGGTINAIQLDIDGDGLQAPEFSITGLGGVSASSFAIGSGSASAQRDAFWAAALGGDDSVNFTMVSYANAILFAGDGSDISDGQAHVGGADTLTGGAQAHGGASIISGDYFDIVSGSATGGADSISVGALTVTGDFNTIFAGANGVGGNDVITPPKYDSNLPGIFAVVGDAFSVSGSLTGGNDFIDLRSTDLTGYGRTRTRLIGDAFEVLGTGVLTAGNDTIHGTALGDDIFGDYLGSIGAVSGGNDLLFGYDGDDFIEGQTGDDTLDGGLGADSLDGGAGIDTASYANAAAGVRVILWQGIGNVGEANGDTLTSIERVVGSAFNDTLVGSGLAQTLIGGAGDDRFFADAGDDFIEGGLGADLIDGGAGNDTASYANAAAGVRVVLWQGIGNAGEANGDTLTSIERVVGSAFSDTLVGSGLAQTLIGGAGDDRFFADGGNDLLDGGLGADYFDGGAGVDAVTYVNAASGVHVNMGLGLAAGVSGEAAGDSLVSIEQIIGSSFNDTLIGDAAGQTLEGGLGADSLNGGAGVDTASYANAAAGVRVILWQGIGNAGEANGDTLVSIERIIGSAFNDTLVGSGLAQTLTGGAGDDRFFADAGDDFIDGGLGADLIDGGAGNDTASYANAAAGVSVALWQGLGLAGEAAGDTLTSIEQIIGSAFNDTLVGSGAAQTLSGGDGDDRFFADSGNDRVEGGAGADIILGQKGDDTLNGGLGNDTFTFSVGDGNDRIEDFAGGAGAGDVIRLLGFGPTLDTFTEVINASTQVGGDVVINLGAGQSITLVGVTLGALAADDFSFT